MSGSFLFLSEDTCCGSHHVTRKLKSRGEPCVDTPSKSPAKVSASLCARRISEWAFSWLEPHSSNSSWGPRHYGAKKGWLHCALSDFLTYRNCERWQGIIEFLGVWFVMWHYITNSSVKLDETKVSPFIAPWISKFHSEFRVRNSWRALTHLALLMNKSNWRLSYIWGELEWERSVLFSWSDDALIIISKWLAGSFHSQIR